jgi:maltooligosyltrehalose trehalohydrolase
VRPIGEHGFNLDGQWSDDFHHAVHAALTGERRGYYADFGPVSMIADALREPFVYDGRYSVHRRRRHGTPSTGVSRERFVVCIQNHDQVGNRARGDRIATLLSPAQQRLAAALMLLSPYVPLLFMGEEYGETNPFQYFVDHSDEQLVAAVRDGRRREFESFGWTADVPDPFDEETFRRSKVDLSKADAEPNARLLTLYRDLLTVRREDPLMRPGNARISVAYGEPGWITLLREPADGAAERASVTLFNCSDADLEIPLPDSGTRAWTVRLSTDDTRYGGRGDGAALAEQTAAVPAWSAALVSELNGPSSTES